jgi:catechol 1,2-dioxygenase
MNLRGVFTTDEGGGISFRTVRPAGYPIPLSGPVGALLRMQGRHNLRPAHVHFMIVKPGFKTQFSQVYASDDPNLETDVQFAVTRRLVGQFVRHDDRPAPASDVSGTWYSLDYEFTLEPGESRLPKPPITGKAGGEPPKVEILERR